VGGVLSGQIDKTGRLVFSGGLTKDRSWRHSARGLNGRRTFNKQRQEVRAEGSPDLLPSGGTIIGEAIPVIGEMADGSHLLCS